MDLHRPVILETLSHVLESGGISLKLALFCATWGSHAVMGKRLSGVDSLCGGLKECCALEPVFLT